MKKPEEIKKGLECYINHGECKKHPRCNGCPYKIYTPDEVYGNVPIRDALALIQQLEADNSRLNDTIRSLTDLLNAAHEETAKAIRERDAAVDALHGDCSRCCWQQTEKCATCRHDAGAWNTHEDNWEWEGVCPENTEVQEDG